MERRLGSITTRGIVLEKGQTLRAMYSQRVPLYEKYAGIIVDCENEDFEKIVQKIVHAVHQS